MIYRNVLPYNIDRKSLAAGKPTKENGHGLLAEPLWSKGESRRDPWTVASAAVSRPSLRYIMDPAKMASPFGWRNVLTNSAKIANIIGGYRRHPILRRTADCIEAALASRLSAEARWR